jgi:hypothetical protein
MYTDEVYYGYGVDKHPRLKKTYAQFRARLTIMSGERPGRREEREGREAYLEGRLLKRTSLSARWRRRESKRV